MKIKVRTVRKVHSSTMFAVLLVLLLTILIGGGWHDVSAQEAIISPEEAIAAAIGQEAGANDFRISDAGDDNASDAHGAAIVYNAIENEYLVVWSGNEIESPLGSQDAIYGQRIDADSGKELGRNDFRISQVIAHGYARDPEVVYNPIGNQYLVVWSGDANVATGSEIYGQLLNADGTEAGADDFRISNMGPDGDSNFHAFDPDVSHSLTTDRYFVVWHGGAGGMGSEKDVDEIFGQLLTSSGGAFGVNDLRISDMGDGRIGTAPSDFRARSPAIAYNPLLDQFLVVWDGNDDAHGVQNEGNEIYGELLSSSGESVGPNDFRISTTGPDGVAKYGARFSDATYNADSNEYLIVWRSNDNRGNQSVDEDEVYGQRLTADGEEIGANDFRISDMGIDGIADYGALGPTVVYNDLHQEYLVLWHGDDNSDGGAEGEFEIFGQRLALDGSDVGDNDFRISDLGPRGDREYDARRATAAVNTISGEYAIGFQGDDDTGELAEDEVEIYLQRLAPNGKEVGQDDQRISDIGSDTVADARLPAIAYNSVDDEYLVVWSADDVRSEQIVDEEFEIFGQRIDAKTGREVGRNDFRISNMGGINNSDFDAYAPAVVHNPDRNEYLVVWEGNEYVDGQDDGDYEIYGQLLAADGTEIGVGGFQISLSGITAVNPDYSAHAPDVAFNAALQQYLVVWSGKEFYLDGIRGVGEVEIHGQLLDAAGAEIGRDDFRISHAGPDLDSDYEAVDPAVVFNPDQQEYVVVWAIRQVSGENTAAVRDISGQRLQADGTILLAEDLRISNMEEQQLGIGHAPDIAYNPVDQEYLVVFQGANGLEAGSLPYAQRLDADGGRRDTDSFMIGPPDRNAVLPAVAYHRGAHRFLVTWLVAFVDSPSERGIFGTVLNPTTPEVDATNLRVSDVGFTNLPGQRFPSNAIACQPAVARCLVVWEGDSTVGTLIEHEFEIFGQFLGIGFAPTARPDAYVMTQSQTLVVDAPGLLQNDEDPDDQSLTVVLENGTNNGTLTLNVDGSFVYQPVPDFVGTDRFTYHVSDGTEVSEPAEVTIMVNAAQDKPDTGNPDPPAADLPVLYISSSSDGEVDGIRFRDEDILAFDSVSQSWTLLIDGSDIGLGTTDINAFHWLTAGTLLFSVNEPVELPGIGPVDDSDVVRFIPETLGKETKGTFELFLTGAEYGLTDPSEDIDALSFGGFPLIVSTLGQANPVGSNGELTVNDEDLTDIFEEDEDYTEADDAEVTLRFDGTAFGLTERSEDIHALHFGDGNLHFSTKGDYEIDGLSGDGDDIILCKRDRTGEIVWPCSLRFDGDLHGFGDESIDAFSVGQAGVIGSETSDDIDPLDPDGDNSDDDDNVAVEHLLFLPVVTR